MRSVASLPVFALLTVVPSADPAPRHASTALNALPATSYACLHYAGLAQGSEAAGEHGLVQLAERLCESFDRQLLPAELKQGVPQAVAALEQFEKQLGQAGLDRATLAELLQGPMAIGVSRPTFFQDMPMPSVALALHVREPRALHRVLTTAQGAMDQMPGLAMQSSTEDFEGQELHLFHQPGVMGTVALAYVEDHFVLSNSAGYLRDCVRSLLGLESSMADLRSLGDARDRIDGDDLMSAFLNVDQLAGWFERFLPYEVDAFTDALGLRSFDGVYMGMGSSGSSSKEVVHVGVRGPSHGVVRSLLRPVSHRAAEMCPPETLAYATSAIDPLGMYEAVKRFLAMLPEDMAAPVMEQLLADRQLQQGLEMLSLLGPEIAIALPMPGAAGLVPEALAFVQSPEPETALQLLLQEVRNNGLEFREAQFRGQTVYYTAITEGQMRFNPAVTVYDGMLVAASELRSLKAAIARDGQPGRSLADQQAFQQSVDESGEVSFMLQLRIGDNVEGIYRLLLPFLEQALDENPEFGLDAMVLPDQEEMRNALSDLRIGLGADAQGIFLETTAPIGLGSIGAILCRYVDLLLRVEPAEVADWVGLAGGGKPEKKIR